MTYGDRLGQDGAYSALEGSYVGPPPFIPVRVTAGLEKLATLTATSPEEETTTVYGTITSTEYLTVTGSQTPTPATFDESTTFTTTTWTRFSTITEYETAPPSPDATLAAVLDSSTKTAIPQTKPQELPSTYHGFPMLLSVNGIVIMSVFCAAVVYAAVSVYKARYARC